MKSKQESDNITKLTDRLILMTAISVKSTQGHKGHIGRSKDILAVVAEVIW